MSGTTEAYSRVKIDALLKDAGWNLTDGVSVLFEHALPDGSRADYVLCDRSGRPLAALEAKRASINSVEAQDQGRHYAEQLGVPFVFLSNGEEVWYLDRETDAHARQVATFYAPDDLERRIAARRNRLDLSSVEIDRRIVDRDYQIVCIEALCGEVSQGRRKLLVEMATGTGKTRTAAAFVKRLFEAGIVTRVLFLVDRIALAGQAEDAFNDHLRDYPCHVLRPGRGFDRTKRITIATLQTMITEYRDLSSGYFDLVITDGRSVPAAGECLVGAGVRNAARLPGARSPACQREYRFAVCAEEEPREERVDLQVSAALLDGMQKAPPAGDGVVSVGADETAAVEEVDNLDASRGLANHRPTPLDTATLPVRGPRTATELTPMHLLTLGWHRSRGRVSPKQPARGRLGRASQTGVRRPTPATRVGPSPGPVKPHPVAATRRRRRWRSSSAVHRHGSPSGVRRAKGHSSSQSHF